MPKERLDILVQQRTGLTRSQAQGLILTGNVLGADGQKIDKPGLRVADDIALTIRESARFVSRGGDKLEAAFDAFPLDVTGVVAMDVGASTGGFTDCLLQRGAIKVYAFDVGTNQMVWKLRNDPRVICRENFNVRHMQPTDVPEEVDIIVADVSFISLTLVLPGALSVLKPGGQALVLVKPQFELTREDIGPGGIVRDPEAHTRACQRIQHFVQSQPHLEWRGLIESSIQGTDGNREFLAHIVSPPADA